MASNICLDFTISGVQDIRREILMVRIALRLSKLSVFVFEIKKNLGFINTRFLANVGKM
jgi:hypothetical protein